MNNGSISDFIDNIAELMTVRRLPWGRGGRNASYRPIPNIYSQPITYYSLLITYYSLLITPYLLLLTYYSLLITHYSLLIT